MTTRVVATQEELNKAIADKVEWIEIRSPAGVWIDVTACDSSTVRACGSSTVRACDSSTVTAYGSSTVTAFGSSTVRACDSSTVTAYGSSTVRACDSSTVTAYGSSTVTAYGSSTVRACDSSTVTAYGSSTVRACDSSTVTAYGSSTVRAYGSSTVRACDSSTVTAYGSSTVRACDSSTVTACDSSTVTAYGSSTVTACDSSTVTACPSVAVHLHNATVKVTGGVVLDHTKVKDFTGKEWCDYHGVEVKRGIATVFKAVNDEWTTDRGFDYSPGAKPSCDDWRDEDNCGGGLHFGPTPFHALAYFTGATKFVAVGVKVTELRPITGATPKCKAPKVVRACVQVDIDGKPIPRVALHQ
jgi:hypothetical protein